MARKKTRKPRPVDRAMAASRKPKEVLRKLWVEEVKRHFNVRVNQPEPHYLTLSGADGKDILALKDAGIIQTNPTGSVTAETVSRVVAIENSPPAALSLRRLMPGLRIKEISIGSLLRGERPLRFPEGEDISFCRASVVNLDLNQRLIDQHDGGDLTFPLMLWIRKFGQIHADRPRKPWTICLTLHAEIGWSVAGGQFICNLIKENFGMNAAFRATCERFLGEAIVDKFDRGIPPRPEMFSSVDQQRLLMVVVPKQIADTVREQRWVIEVHANLRYGSRNAGTAPMTSWIIRFGEPQNSHATAQQIYSANLANILGAPSAIDDSGSLAADAPGA